MQSTASQGSAEYDELHCPVKAAWWQGIQQWVQGGERRQRH
jgi:hypothetical protein